MALRGRKIENFDGFATLLVIGIIPSLPHLLKGLRHCNYDFLIILEKANVIIHLHSRPNDWSCSKEIFTQYSMKFILVFLWRRLTFSKKETISGNGNFVLLWTLHKAKRVKNFMDPLEVPTYILTKLEGRAQWPKIADSWTSLQTCP